MQNPFETICQRLDAIQTELQEIKCKPDQIQEPEVRLLSAEQVCSLLSISRTTLWSWDKKGITHPVRIGNLKRYRYPDILGLITSKDEHNA